MSKHKHRYDHQHKRQQFVTPPRRSAALSWNAIIIATGLLFLAAVLYVTRSSAGSGTGEPTEIAARGGDVFLNASLFDDGQARFYRYATTAGRAIQFFVMKSSDGVIRAAFDACDVCYRERRGYRQQGDVMICNNCGQAFRSVDVNVLQGGCNPAPLERAVEGGQVVLKAPALEAGAGYF